MHVSIIVPQGELILSSIVGSFKVFNLVNGYLIQSRVEAEPFYKVDLVGISGESMIYGGLFSIHPNKHIDDVEKTDLVIVTTINGDMEQALETNAAFIPWIQKMKANGAEVASLCMGAFMLAETGLLDGKPAATHWMGAEQFQEKYPLVHLQTEKVITDDDGTYTSGGAFSFLNLLLYLVEKYNTKEAAIWVAKVLEIEFGREDQNQFIIFQGQKEHSDSAVIKAQEYIEANYQERLSVEDLADNAALSRRNFVRRFKKATSNTPLEYIQRVKIEVAKKQFELSKENVNEVMYHVGYNDTKAFRSVFKKYTGLTPSEYKVRYNKVS